MFSVRELAELVRRLDGEGFVHQMGPFALMQRPPPDERVEAGRDYSGETRLQPSFKLRGVPSMVDFGDMMLATIPPLQADGTIQLIIGRAPDCDLVVHDPMMSKHHARVVWNGRQAILEELGSVNGTFVNNHKMKDRWTLRDGDELGFGDSHFLFISTAALYTRLRTLSGEPVER